jgi:hypothetical protein
MARRGVGCRAPTPQRDNLPTTQYGSGVLGVLGGAERPSLLAYFHSLCSHHDAGKSKKWPAVWTAE